MSIYQHISHCYKTIIKLKHQKKDMLNFVNHPFRSFFPFHLLGVPSWLGKHLHENLIQPMDSLIDDISYII